MVAICAPTNSSSVPGPTSASARPCSSWRNLPSVTTVRIAFENIFTTEPGQYRQTPVEVAETVKAVGHQNLVALIDFSHAYIEATYRGLNFREQIRMPGTGCWPSACPRPSVARRPSTSRHHLKESTALGIGDLHMPLGWGDIDWEDIFSELEFLPDTVLMMEDRRPLSQANSASLERAKRLIALNSNRTAAAAAE